MNEEKYATRWRQAAILPSGLNRRLRKMIKHAALSLSSLKSKLLEESFLRCICCHYVFDDQRTDFERLILTLKETGEFIDTDTCVQILRGEVALDRHFLHLSIDDGFRNNFTNAFPILRKHRVPAMFFVPSALIEANYEDARAYCLEAARYNSVIEMLTWEDLKEMVSHGYEIGSHTRTHVRFSSISQDAAQLEHEILGSKNEIETRLGGACNYISWPYGKLADADEESLKMVEKAGYRACFGAFRGAVVPQETDAFRIPRYHFEVQWPTSHVVCLARGHMDRF